MVRRALIFMLVLAAGLILVGQAEANVTQVTNDGTTLTVDISGSSPAADDLTVVGDSSAISVSGVNGTPTFTSSNGATCSPDTGTFTAGAFTCSTTGTYTTLKVIGTGSSEGETVNLGAAGSDALSLGTAQSPGTADIELGSGADALDVLGPIGTQLYYGPNPAATSCSGTDAGTGSSNAVSFAGSVADTTTICSGSDTTATFTGAQINAPLTVTTGNSNDDSVSLKGLAINAATTLTTGNGDDDDVNLEGVAAATSAGISVSTGTGTGDTVDLSDGAQLSGSTPLTLAGAGGDAFKLNGSTFADGATVTTGPAASSVTLAGSTLGGSVDVGSAACSGACTPAGAETISLDDATLNGSAQLTTDNGAGDDVDLEDLQAQNSTGVSVTTGTGASDEVDLTADADLGGSAPLTIVNEGGANDELDGASSFGAAVSVTTGPDLGTVDAEGATFSGALTVAPGSSGVNGDQAGCSNDGNGGGSCIDLDDATLNASAMLATDNANADEVELEDLQAQNSTGVTVAMGSGAGDVVDADGAVFGPNANFTVTGSGEKLELNGSSFGDGVSFGTASKPDTGAVDLSDATLSGKVSVVSDYTSASASDPGITLQGAMMAAAATLSLSTVTPAGDSDDVSLGCLQDPYAGAIAVTSGAGGGTLTSTDASLGTVMTAPVATTCGVAVEAGPSTPAATGAVCSTAAGANGVVFDLGTGAESVDIATTTTGMPVCVQPASSTGSGTSVDDTVSVSGVLGGALSLTTDDAAGQTNPSGQVDVNLNGLNDSAGEPITILTGFATGDIVDFQPSAVAAATSATVTLPGPSATVNANTVEVGLTVDETNANGAVDLASDTGAASFQYTSASAITTSPGSGNGAQFNGATTFTTTANAVDVVDAAAVYPADILTAGVSGQKIDYGSTPSASDSLNINLAAGTVTDESTNPTEVQAINGFEAATGGSGNNTIEPTACPAADQAAAPQCGALNGGTGSHASNTVSFTDVAPADQPTDTINLPQATGSVVDNGDTEDYTLDDFENATGGTGSNTFYPLTTAPGSFGGTQGTNAVDYDEPVASGTANMNPVVVMDFGAQTATLAGGIVDTLTDVTTFDGGSGQDTAEVAQNFGTDTVNFLANSTQNTIDFHEISSAQAFTFPVNTQNEVSVDGFSYPDIGTVVGSSGSPTFDAPTGTTNVAIEGAPLTGTNTAGDTELSYSGDSTAVTVNLATGVATGFTASAPAVSNIQTVDGGGGTATLTAGAGNVTLEAENGANDVLTGGAGDDTLTVGSGNSDVLNAGTGYDIISAGSGTGDQINGSAGSSATGQITATGDEAAINPGAGTYYVDAQGGAGDVIQGGTGANTIVGGSESTVSFQGQSAAVTIDLTGGADSGAQNQDETISGVNNAVGAENSTTFIGNAQNDILQGESGTNTFEPGTGDETLEGGSGTNLISFANAPASDSVTVNLAANSATDGNATDRLLGINDVMFGPGPSTFVGGSGTEAVTGGSGDDTFTGGSGTETISTGDGNDSVQAGTGADTITTGKGTNFVNLRNGNQTTETVTCGSGANTVLSEPWDSTTSCSDVVLPAPTLGGNQAPPTPTVTTPTTPAPPAPVYLPISASLTSKFTVIKTAPKAPKPKKGKKVKKVAKPVDTKGYTRVTELELKKVGADTTVLATCSDAKAKNCPFKTTQDVIQNQQATYSLSGLFGDVPVTPGVKFTLTLSESGTISRIYTFTFVKSKQPTETIQCQTPGQKVGACSSS